MREKKMIKPPFIIMKIKSQLPIHFLIKTLFLAIIFPNLSLFGKIIQVILFRK